MQDTFTLTHSLYLTIPKLHQLNPNLITGFTIRNRDFHWNTSSINDSKDARKYLAKQLNIPITYWVSGQQTHGINVRLVKESDIGKGGDCFQTAFKETDGLITSEKNILLTAYFADCVPLYFYDLEKDIIGIAHAGWRGTIRGIAKEMVLKFISLGSKLSSIYVTIGPAISQKHYEVSEEIVDKINPQLQKKVLRITKDKRLFLDLKQLNKELLLQSGIIHSNIEVTDYCTYESKNLFFSYRREQESAGRMLGFIGQT